MNPKILVTEDNRDAIDELLNDVNGDARTHTFRSDLIIDLAETAEDRGMKLVGNGRLLVGAKYRATSGEELPKSYDWRRFVNKVELIRRREGWVINSMEKTQIWSSVPKPELILTTPAADKAVADFRKTFQIAID